MILLKMWKLMKMLKLQTPNDRCIYFYSVAIPLEQLLLLKIRIRNYRMFFKNIRCHISQHLNQALFAWSL